MAKDLTNDQQIDYIMPRLMQVARQHNCVLLKGYECLVVIHAPTVISFTDAIDLFNNDELDKLDKIVADACDLAGFKSVFRL